MTNRHCMPWLLGLIMLATWAAGGCGTDPASARPDIAAIPAEEHFGRAVKTMVYEFRAKVRKRGVAAAKQELPIMLENFDGYEKRELGQHREAYQQIHGKLKELETSLAGSPTRDAVMKVADEVATLADTLPGQADPNPDVE